MLRRIILITKDPDFDERGEVVLGQCEPFTAGWSLKLVRTDKSYETLLVGNYMDLRKIQEHCLAIEDPEAIKKRVNEMRALLSSSVTETVAVEFSASPPPSESARILDPTQTGVLPAVPASVQLTSGEGFFQLRKEDGVVVALFADPERAGDVSVLNQQLRKLLELKPRAIVLDLEHIQNIPSRAVQEVVLFRDHCRDAQIGFGLCNLRKSVQKLIENLGLENPPAVYENSAAALAEIGTGKGSV